MTNAIDHVLAVHTRAPHEATMTLTATASGSRFPALAGRRASHVWRVLVVSLATLAFVVAAGTTAAHAQGGTAEYYATDALGSIRVVFDSTGAVAARSDYLPFGEAWAPTGNLPTQRFTGQQRDGDEGFDYFNARSYQTRAGRFEKVDPVFAGLFQPQAWNRYAYARNNPLTYTDPTGLDPRPCTQDGYINELGVLVVNTQQCAGGGAPAITTLQKSPQFWSTGGNYTEYGLQMQTQNDQYQELFVHGVDPWAQPPVMGLVNTTKAVATVAAVVEPGPIGELVLLAGLTAAEILLKDAQAAGERKPGEIEYLLHYTNDRAVRGIGLGGVILPSGDGKVYLTQDIYPNGAAAQAALAMKTTPTGIYIIPRSRVPNAIGPFPVEGGTGFEWRNPGPVNAVFTPYIPLNP
jgi:RHS repeat-associated protein